MSLPRGHRNRQLKLEYFETSYGPTLRVEAATRSLVKAFIEPIALLARRQAAHVDLLRRLDAVHSDIGGWELFLLEDGRKGELRILPGASMLPHFIWSNDAEGWQICLELIDPLLRSFEPGHVYLTREGSDDALVELSYGEV